MEIVTGYRGKPHITSEKWADLNRGIIGAEEYVLGVGRMFESELVSNNLLKIYDGCGVFQGREFSTLAGKSDEITIENGMQGEKRIDLIVARYTKNEDTKIETIEPVLIKGASSASDPVVPKHTEGNIRQGDLIADMPLYEVELNGINVVEVRPLFQVLMNMNKINKNLSDILHEELEFNGLNLCTDIHSAILNSSAKGISFFKRGKTLNMTINIELKANVNQYATLLRLPEKFRPKINQLFVSGGTTYSINSETGAITPQQKIVSGAWMQISIEYQL